MINTKPTLYNGNGNSLGLFDEFFNDIESFFGNTRYPIPSRKRSTADIVENENSYEVFLDVPGVSNEDVSVEVKNNVLTVRAERNDVDQSRENNYSSYSSKQSSYSYTLKLNEEINQDSISASLKNGVLNIDLPKRFIGEKQDVKTIEVN